MTDFVEFELEQIKKIWENLTDYEKCFLCQEEVSGFRGAENGLLCTRPSKEVESEHGNLYKSNGKRYFQVYYDDDKTKRLVQLNLLCYADPNQGNPGYSPWWYRLTKLGKDVARVGKLLRLNKIMEKENVG